MKIKVCGMTDPENIAKLTELPIDFMGLIFYSKSPRYVGNFNPDTFNILPKSIKKVGVFVNEQPQRLLDRIDKFRLDVIQLHGQESLEYVNEIKQANPSVAIIKVFSISESSDFIRSKEYEEGVDYFLFDTKTPQYGGSGKKFNWEILNNYKGNIPFFLSGGISAEDEDPINKIKHSKLYGLDLNSKFETQPGIKKIHLLEKFIKKFKDEQN